MKFKLFYFILVACFLVISNGCDSSSETETNPINNLVANPDFMFNTTITVSLEFQSTLSGASIGGAYLEIFDALPGENSNLLLQAYTDDQGSFSHNITLPASKTSIFLVNANRDFFEFEVIRLDDLTGSVTGSFNSPYNSSSREAPAWSYSTSPYYSTIYSETYDENAAAWNNDTSDMFGCFLGNTCIGVTGGIYPGATLLPDNRVLFTTIMYLPNTSSHLINFRYYDASENQVYLMDSWQYVTAAENLGNTQNPYEFYYGSWNMMPDAYLISCSSPGVGQYGMLAFEDNWPQQGDYDINDLVIYGNFSYYVTEMVGDDYTGYFEIAYKVAAIGASYTIGFAIQFPENFQLSNITSSNGLSYVEADNRTVVFCDNVRDFLPGAGGGFINTQQGQTHFDAEYDTVTFDFYYNSEMRMVMMPWYEPPYNPFIFTNGVRSHEIHPADYPPTELADLNLWGTMDDTSIPDEWRYYRTENNLPWVFMLPIAAPYPLERTSILDAYPYFDDWVESPWEYEDWYLDLPGQRNPENLYSPPGK
ncbi:MAG: LruC domain-containing protein [Candidatus Cloacimonetes bacterium]|nr:LruC domain-containing protein [Candidatus Cloacimonadota bacterium]